MIKLTILMPCLNEAETLAMCIRKAHEGAKSAGFAPDDYEVLVADNGSTDGSQAIARAANARIIDVPVRGYGAALRAGIDAAYGNYIIMGDSDASYDFAAIAPFIEKLDEGYGLVMGTRMKGKIEPGAMPILHRYLGNPVLTFIGNALFSCSLSDFHCGMRGFTQQAMQSLDLRTNGMEFASEMVIRATLSHMKRTEVPITLYPDGRSRPPHLRTWRDGWRHLRFMLLYSPLWVFIYPGLFLWGVSAVVTAVLLAGPLTIGDVVFDVHTLLIMSTLLLSSSQIILMGLLAMAYAARLRILPPRQWLIRFIDRFSLGHGLVVSILLAVAGIAIFAIQLRTWQSADFGPLDYQKTLRPVVLGLIMLITGIQLFFWSFMASLFSISTSPDDNPVDLRTNLAESDVMSGRST